MAAKRSALVVAADTYVDRTLQPLRTPATDADALVEVLRDREIGGFDVEVLLNEPQATVKQRLEAFFKDRQRDDVLLLHFACHGVTDQWRNLYFAMRDTDVKSLASTAIEQTWIRRLMEYSRARTKVLLLDCCFSGLALKGTRAGGRIDVVEGFEVEERSGQKASGIAVMTATSAMEYAVDVDQLTATNGQGETSVFTTALVHGLASGEAAGKHGWVTFDSLYEYVLDYLADQGASQSPERSVSGQGDLRIAKRAAPKPGLARPGGRLDYANLQQLFVLDGTGDELFSIAFSPDMRMLVAGTDCAVLAWHGAEPIREWSRDALPEPEVLVVHEKYVYTAAFSPDGQLLASAGEDGVVLITNLVTRETRTTREKHREAVYCVEFSPDGAELASGGWDGQVIVWDQRSGNVRRRLDKGIGRVSSLAFSPPRRDEKRLLAIGSLDNTITLWDRALGTTERLGTHESSVEAVAWSPLEEEELLASCGLDKAIRVWDVAARAQRWKNDTEHGYLVRTVAFSPEGSTLASASWDKRMRLWDVATREPREMPRDAEWEEHTDWIWSVAFSRNGLLLASAGSDSKVIVWGLPDAVDGQ